MLNLRKMENIGQTYIGQIRFLHEQVNEVRPTLVSYLVEFTNLLNSRKMEKWIIR